MSSLFAIVAIIPVYSIVSLTPQASGVSVDKECLDKFQELKLKKTHKYIIYTLSSDKTKIVIEKTGSSREYEDFIADLPEDDCRWAVYDVHYEKEGAGLRNKLVFIAWYEADFCCFLLGFFVALLTQTNNLY